MQAHCIQRLQQSPSFRRKFPSSFSNCTKKNNKSKSGSIDSTFGLIRCASAERTSNWINYTCSSSFSSTSKRAKRNSEFLTNKEKIFRERGWIDEHGLTDFNTLYELTTRSNEVFAENKAFGTYSPETKQYEYATYQEIAGQISKCRVVLKELGVAEHGKIGLISNNRWEWTVVAAAAFSINATIVPMYEAQLSTDWTYIINNSGCSVLFCATQDIFDRVQKDVNPSTPMLQSVLCFDAPAEEHFSFKRMMLKVAEDKEGTLIAEPLPEDLANLIYTSGTTGKPKGVELTHLNFTSNIKGSRNSLDDVKDFIRQTDRSLSFLPWAHSYGQTCELWNGWAHGTSMAVCRGIPYILDDLQMVKPTVLCAVPTLYKKVFDGVQNLVESSSPTKKTLLRRALQLGRMKVEVDRGNAPPLNFVQNLQFQILDSIVLSKIRDKFGGNLRHGFVAGAACPKEVLDFMDSLGIEVFEGYGLTETSPIICINSPGKRKVGSVGRPIDGVTVYIVDKNGQPLSNGKEGEICCVGPNVMKGYYNKEETDKVVTVAPDGKSRMFKTGDLGHQTESGFIKITGRAKEQYKLENGKYVVPTPIEEAIGMSRFISQVILSGANRPYNVALIAPDWDAIRNEMGIADEVSNEELTNYASIRDLIDSEIRYTCYKIQKFAVPKKWAFIAPCTVANSLLTAKMSIRRHKVIETYNELISNLYGDKVLETQERNRGDGVSTAA